MGLCIYVVHVLVHGGATEIINRGGAVVSRARRSRGERNVW